MKKIFFSLLAIGAIASCAKTEAVYTEGETEIQLAPVTALSTKANVNGVIDGITYPTAENFNVYAYWANEAAGSQFETAETYLNNVEFKNKGKFWGGTTTYYWPKNGSLRFSAYSPSSLSMAHYLASDVYELNGLTYPTDIAKSYDILVAPTTESYTAQTAAEKVSVVFEHALSWITFKLVSAEVANNVFTVTDVIVNDVNTHGNMVADMKADTKTWTTAMPKAITVFDKANGTNVTTTAAIFENGGNTGTKFLALPQATTTVTINFTQNEMEGTPKLENQTVTIPLTLAGDEPWEAGKHYTYTVIFDLDEILINPSVEDWEEVTVPTIDATATEVTNQEELQAALSAGRNVRLTEDINLTAPIVVGDGYVTKAAAVIDVTVDLNGKTITSTKDAFEVKDGTLTIVGDGNVKAASTNGEPYCAVWAYGDAVVNIYGGVYEAGYPAGDYNDLIYAKENATINIYGGEFMNSGRENAFVLNLKDEDRATAAINVAGGKFHNFDPSDNKSETEHTNFLVEGYGSYELEAGVWTVVKKTEEIRINTVEALQDAAFHGAVAVLDANLALETSLLVKGNLTLNLNDKQLTSKQDVFDVTDTLTVNGRGDVVAATENTCSWCAVFAHGNGVVTLNGGDYKVGAPAGDYNDLVYAKENAKVVVNGGTYYAEGATRADGVEFVLNLKDADVATAAITVYGGAFENFNPAAAETESVAAYNFVAPGYKAYANGNFYVVVAE